MGTPRRAPTYIKFNKFYILYNKTIIKIKIILIFISLRLINLKSKNNTLDKKSLNYIFKELWDIK